MNSDYQYVNQSRLGEMFGATSHKIGRWLDALGLRENKRPSAVAHQHGFVEATATGRGSGFYYVWHRHKTVAALVEAGHTLVGEEKQTVQIPDSILLTGPFVSRANSEDGFEIAGGDGTVAVWVRGRANAEFLANLLNLAARHGKLPSAEVRCGVNNAAGS